MWVRFLPHLPTIRSGVTQWPSSKLLTCLLEVRFLPPEPNLTREPDAYNIHTNMRTFTQFLAEEPTPKLSLADFPTILADADARPAANGNRIRRDLSAVIDAINAHPTGDVPNPKFVSAKADANYLVDRLRDRPEWVWDIFRAARDSGQAYWDLYDVFPNYINDVPRKLKMAEQQLQAFRDKEYIVQQLNWAIPIMKELVPISTAIADMKARAVKRQPKAPEDATSKYVAPMVSNAAGKLVMDVLTTLTDQTRTELEAMIATSFINAMEVFAAKDAKEQRMVLRQHYPEVLRLHKAWNPDTTRVGHYTLSSTYQDVARAAAVEQAKFIQDQFVIKNAKKLKSIIDRKTQQSAMKGAPTILRVNVRDAIEAGIRIAFEDGSQFTVATKVVYKYTMYGKPFVQYPTTFHDVVMPDGSKMGQPSEQRMNEIFAVA